MATLTYRQAWQATPEARVSDWVLFPRTVGGQKRDPQFESATCLRIAATSSRADNRRAFLLHRCTAWRQACVLHRYDLSMPYTRLITVSRVISRHQQKRLTYDGLDSESNTLACGLLNAGVKRGNRVAVSLGNNIEFATVRGTSTMSWRSQGADERQGDLCPFQAWSYTGRHPRSP